MKDKEVLGCTLLAAAIPVIIAANAVIHGWALSVLWSWFIVPIFSLPLLTIPQSIGVACVVALFKSIPSSNKDETTGEKVGKIVGGLIAPLFAVAFGWIVKGFL